MNKWILYVSFCYVISGSAYGQTELLSFKIACLHDIFYSDDLVYANRIVSTTTVNDTFKIIVAKTDDCINEYSFGKVKYHNDTLRLYYYTKKSDSGINLTTMCDCPFEFTYMIKGIKGIPRTIFLNDSIFVYKPDKFKTFNVEYKVLGDDTINYVDKFGLRQKRWIMLDVDTVDWLGKKEFVKVNHDYIYLNNEIYYGSRTMYDKNYKLYSILRFNKDGSRDAYLFDKEGRLVKHEIIK